MEECPLTFKDVMLSIVSTFYKEDTNNKIESPKTNGTWDLCDFPPGCKWIFRRKLRPNCAIDK